jgi:hypothetical protein
MGVVDGFSTYMDIVWRIRAFLTLGSGESGMEKNAEPGSGIKDEHPGS